MTHAPSIESETAVFVEDRVTVERRVTGILFAAANCAELVAFHFQIGCEVARDLFPRLVDQCVFPEGGGFPETRWREPPRNTPLEVYAAVE